MYNTALQVPEAPIVEEWAWITDVTTSYNGNEDLIPLLRYPRRTFNGNYRFDTKTDLRRHLAMMTRKFRTEFGFPLYQYGCKLKSAVAIAADTVNINTKRGDFKVDGRAIIIEGSKFEEVTIAEVTADALTFADPLANAFTKNAIVAPLATVFTNTNASVTRANPDHSATSSFSFIERVPTVPLVSPLNASVIAMFDGLPILPHVPIGSTFDQALATGLQPVDYVGLIDIVTPWTFTQWAYAANFKIDRLSDLDDWEWWIRFADTIQGSANPFLFPTNREDMQVVTPAAQGGVGITVKGDEFSQHYWGHGGFSRIFIDTDAGRHYAKVTGISAVAGNDRLTFAPALPVGAGWSNNQRVGFLLKVRNDNDKIAFTHYGLTTEVALALRTVL